MFSIGLVGCGRWGKNHLNVLMKLLDEGVVQRISVCDVDPTQLAGLSVDAVYTHIDDLLAEETLDAVALVTPPESHLDLLSQALEADIPVLVEKPLSDDHQATHAMLENLPKNAVMLVGYLLRHHPGLRRIKSAIEDNAVSQIETVAYVRRTQRPWPEDLDALTTLAVHGLDAVSWLLDQPLMDMDVVFIDRQSDAVLLRLADASGRMAIVDVAWGADDEIRAVAVQSPSVDASLDFGSGQLVWRPKDDDDQDPVMEEYAGQALEEEWRAFLDMVKSGQPAVNPSVHELLDQSQWMHTNG
ncbi:MAG: Gfo/Idh/MocA family protein [Poseidonia sp.]|jgi:predicted dehydrogenase